MNSFKKILQSVEIIIPENSKDMLKQNITYEKNMIAKAIRKCVISQVIFSSNKNSDRWFRIQSTKFKFLHFVDM